MVAAIGVAFALAGCLLADDVDTELVSVCTEAFPVAFEEDRPDLYLTTFAIDGAVLRLQGGYVALGTAQIEVLGGVDDVSFADSVAIVLREQGGSMRRVRLAEVIDPGTDNPLSATGDGDTNLVEYLDDGQSAELRVEIFGDAPVSAFAGTFQACLDVEGWPDDVR